MRTGERRGEKEQDDGEPKLKRSYDDKDEVYKS